MWFTEKEGDIGRVEIPKCDGKNTTTTPKAWLQELRTWRLLAIYTIPEHVHGYNGSRSFTEGSRLKGCANRAPEDKVFLREMMYVQKATFDAEADIAVERLFHSAGRVKGFLF